MKRVSRPDLERAAARLADHITTAQDNLRRALVEAGDTAAARAKLRELECEAAAVSQELGDLSAAAERETQRQIQVRAEKLATGATDRLKATLAELEPPAAPEVP